MVGIKRRNSTLGGRSTAKLIAVAMLLAAQVLVARNATAAPPQRLLYTVTQTSPMQLVVYDIDNGHQIVRTQPLPTLSGELGGIAASAATDRLYITADDRSKGRGVVLAYNLRTNSVLWTKQLSGVDAICVTPNGQHMYVSGGEFAGPDFFFSLNPATGAIRTRIRTGTFPHNAVCGLNNTTAYLSTVTNPDLMVVDTATDTIVKRVRFGEGIRPFSINGRQTIAIANVNKLLGFEVASITTGQRLFRLTVPGFPDPGTARPPSHGIAFTPNEREIWIADAGNRAVHVFSSAGLPTTAPVKVATVRVPNPQWVTVSLDGRFAYVGSQSSLSVISTATRTVVRQLRPTNKQIEIHMTGTDATRTGSRHGLGYVQ